MKLKSICGMLNSFRDSCGALWDSDVRSREGNQTEKIIRNIASIHNILALEPDLKPRHSINSLFEELVSLCTQNINHTDVEKVRNTLYLTTLINFYH